MKESCLILLQTIPGSIDIELFKADLLKSFSDIVSVHDLHIWQLTSSKYVSTVHILFQNPNVSMTMARICVVSVAHIHSRVPFTETTEFIQMSLFYFRTDYFKHRPDHLDSRVNIINLSLALCAQIMEPFH